MNFKKILTLNLEKIFDVGSNNSSCKDKKAFSLLIVFSLLIIIIITNPMTVNASEFGKPNITKVRCSRVEAGLMTYMVIKNEGEDSSFTWGIDPELLPGSYEPWLSECINRSSGTAFWRKGEERRVNLSLPSATVNCTVFVYVTDHPEIRDERSITNIPPPYGTVPGFEVTFAIAGLLAVVYLIRRKK